MKYVLSSIIIESPHINILPIILAADVPLVCHGKRARLFPKELIVARHSIAKRIGEKGRHLRSSGSPWGTDEEGRQALKKAAETFSGPFIIQKQDLKRLCIGLQGADAGYLRFGKCTGHLITFHDGAVQSRGLAASDGPVAEDTSVEDRRAGRRQLILDTYLENLTGFDKFQLQGTSSAVQLDKIMDPHVATQSEVLRDLQYRLAKGRRLVRLQRLSEAADTFVKGAQQIMWLDNRDILQNITWSGKHGVWLSLAPYYFEFLISAARASADHTSRRLASIQELMNGYEEVDNTSIGANSVTVSGASDPEESGPGEIDSGDSGAGDNGAAGSNNGHSTTPKAVSPTAGVVLGSGAHRSVGTSKSGPGAIHNEADPRIEDDEPEASTGLLGDEDMTEMSPQDDLMGNDRVFQTLEVSNSGSEASESDEDARINDSDLNSWEQSLQRTRVVFSRAIPFRFGDSDVKPSSKQQAEIDRLEKDIQALVNIGN